VPDLGAGVCRGASENPYRINWLPVAPHSEVQVWPGRPPTRADRRKHVAGGNFLARMHQRPGDVSVTRHQAVWVLHLDDVAGLSTATREDDLARCNRPHAGAAPGREIDAGVKLRRSRDRIASHAETRRHTSSNRRHHRRLESPVRYRSSGACDASATGAQRHGGEARSQWQNARRLMVGGAVALELGGELARDAEVSAGNQAAGDLLVEGTVEHTVRRRGLQQA